MRYVLIVTVIIAIMFAGKWSIETLDNAILITDYWQATTANEKWKLIQFQENDHTLYDFQSNNKFTGIAKALWPIWLAFALGLVVLPFLVRYIYLAGIDATINSAINAKDQAIERQLAAEKKAQAYKAEMKSWAEEKVSNAYTIQLERVRTELSSKWETYNKEKDKLNEKEKQIEKRERLISSREEASEQKVKKIQQEYQAELTRFQQEKATYTKSRNNAVAAMMRRKATKVTPRATE